MLTTYLGNKLLDHLDGKAAYALPGTLYLALFTAAPTVAGGGTEAAFGAYARLALTGASWTAAAARAVSNAIELLFATSTGPAVANISHWGLFDAAGGGNLLEFEALTGGPIAIGTGDVFRFPIGSLQRTAS